MAAIFDTLEQAQRLHQAGKLVEAERVYSQVLQANGHDAEIWYLLGDTVQAGTSNASPQWPPTRATLEHRPLRPNAR
jgi:hypothetical protein